MRTMNREQRLQTWYREARIGLFVHWGMHTGEHEADPFGPDVRYPYETVEAFESAAEQAGWDASKWIGTAKRLRAQYMTLGTFHCQLGYLKAWHSRISGSRSTKRDFLKEILDAAEPEGIRVIIYINRDSKNAFHGGVEWLDREAYRDYKNDESVDIWSREGYLAYSIEVMEELLENYPRIAGFWFDGYHDKREAQEVFAKLHRVRSDLILINNDFSSGPVEDEDVMSLEDFGKLCEPEFDWASGMWVGPGDKEVVFKTKWDWWYVGEGKPHWDSYALNFESVPDNASTVKRIVSAAGSSWNANLGFGPKIGGDFPEVLEDFVAHFDRYMSWASESIYGTVGGGYDRGGFPPGYWNEGAFGVTTLVPGEETHYLHVLTPPFGHRLTLPDAGYEVTSATDLKTGAALSFGQHDGRLTIEVSSWETAETDGDLIIKLTTVQARRIVPPYRMTASATSDMPYQPAAFVLDGNYNTCFRSAYAIAWPQSLTLSLVDRQKITGLCLTQPETGPVKSGGFAAPLNERLKAFEVHVSDDGVHWGEPVAAGELRNQRGMQVILWEPVTASQVRFTAKNNHGGTGTFQVIGMDVVTASAE
ncbi:hypothetical protein D7Z26_18775 [Cohnella endophytica]|uniref:alpha-L-fucosidase n=1 Tax=Cohnella endophytica TaxID=2419778 RepID=A0A494XGL6_9BACL|nr:alpha-L-fucosidase [Cohnella endophytica]RKP49875.1 hypothetical protein D7Z26_18775 [Cohnella endophytica]